MCPACEERRIKSLLLHWRRETFVSGLSDRPGNWIHWLNLCGEPPAAALFAVFSSVHVWVSFVFFAVGFSTEAQRTDKSLFLGVNFGLCDARTATFTSCRPLRSSGTESCFVAKVKSWTLNPSALPKHHLLVWPQICKREAHILIKLKH